MMYGMYVMENCSKIYFCDLYGKITKIYRLMLSFKYAPGGRIRVEEIPLTEVVAGDDFRLRRKSRIRCSSSNGSGYFEIRTGGILNSGMPQNGRTFAIVDKRYDGDREENEVEDETFEVAKVLVFDGEQNFVYGIEDDSVLMERFFECLPTQETFPQLRASLDEGNAC